MKIIFKLFFFSNNSYVLEDFVFINSFFSISLVKNNSIKYTLKPNFSNFLACYEKPTFELNFPIYKNGIVAEKIILIEKIFIVTISLAFET